MAVFSSYSEAEHQAKQPYDVCICGGGPAGITIARTLARHGRRVAVFEGGGTKLTFDSQKLYKGQELGLNYPISGSRLRFLGGASNHWGGETRPLDARDFQSLPYHEYNEWPISKADLDMYANETSQILDLEKPESCKDLFAGKEAGIELLAPYFRYSSPPTRFGQKYLDEIRKSSYIDLFLNSNLVDIVLDARHQAVSYFVFKTDDNAKPEKVRASQFVLSCGALENPRALLMANKQMKQGIGNTYDQVGRYFCEHIALSIGKAIMRTVDTQPGLFICTDELMKSRKCLSFTIEFGYPSESDDSTFLQRLRKSLFGSSSDSDETDVGIIFQQACNPKNRVTLSDKKDDLGLRQLALNWRDSPLDRHTIRTAAKEVARSLAIHDLGRMQVESFVLDETEDIPIGYMNHHMCSTRMSSSPKKGVVNSDCLIHGLDNFYIGGSSVFASAGVSNPTYTIVQLALRLGDHLHKTLG